LVSCRYDGKIGLTEARINVVEKHFRGTAQPLSCSRDSSPFYVN